MAESPPSLSHLGCPDGPKRRSMKTDGIFPGDGAEEDEHQPVEPETAGGGRCWLRAVKRGCASTRGLSARGGRLLREMKYFGGYLQIPAGTASCKQTGGHISGHT